MNDLLLMYIIWSVIVGLIFSYYYLHVNDTSFFKRLYISQKLAYLFIIFIVPIILAPVAFYELIKLIIKNGGFTK